MRLPARCSILLGFLALGSACASSKPGMPSDAAMHADAYTDVYGGPMAGADMEAAKAAEAMPGAVPTSVATSGAVMPAAVMGSIAPPSAPTGAVVATGGDKAIADDELPTTGDDSVDQMLVFNGALGLAVQPDTIPASIDASVQLAVDAGGYVAQQTDTSLTLRVPSKRFRKLMKGLEALGQVRTRSVQTLDVSEEFHDLEVRLENLQSTRTRIQKLLGQAKDLSEILVVEKELERVSAEIDAIEGRLRFLSSQAAFSTVTMAFQELPREVTIVQPDETPPPPPLPPPARLLDSSAVWIDEVDVHRLMSLQ
jgi:hypothetical protein